MSFSPEDRNYGMIAHGLVLLSGISAFLGSLSFLGLVASIASVVLYFVWKSRSPFVVRHAKQAAGLQVFLFLFSIVMIVLTTVLTAGAAAAGSLGGVFAVIGFAGFISLAVGIAAAVCAVMGLLKAQKGEEYTYPLIGGFIDRINI